MDALRGVVEGAAVASVEGSPAELRLVPAAGDQITVRPEGSGQAEPAASLRFFHEPAFSD